jgi:hypothetical protein
LTNIAGRRHRRTTSAQRYAANEYLFADFLFMSHYMSTATR